MGAGAYLEPSAAEAVREALQQLVDSVQHNVDSMALVAPAMLRVTRQSYEQYLEALCACRLHFTSLTQRSTTMLSWQCKCSHRCIKLLGAVCECDSQVVAALPEQLFGANKAAICAIMRRCPPTAPVRAFF